MARLALYPGSEIDLGKEGIWEDSSRSVLSNTPQALKGRRILNIRLCPLVGVYKNKTKQTKPSIHACVCERSECGGDAERRIESLGALDMGLDSWLMVVRRPSSVVVTGGSRPGANWDGYEEFKRKRAGGS